MKKKSNLSVTATEQRRRTEAKLRKQRKNQRARVPVGRRAVADTEITARKQAEEALQRANDDLTRRGREALAEHQRFFDMVETLPVMVCLLTPDYHVTFANRAFREKFGESNGRHCYDYCCGFDKPCEFCESFVPLKTGQPHHWRFTSPDGSTFIDAYDFPFTDVDGSPAILEMDIDITERKQREEDLERIRWLHAETEKIGKVGGWEFDIDTGKQTWTEETYNIHEMNLSHQPTVEEGINFYTPDSRPIIQRVVRRAIERGEPFDVELEIITAKGNLRNVHAIGKPDIEHRKVYGFFQDITERKRASEALRQSEEQYRLLFEQMHSGIIVLDVVLDQAGSAVDHRLVQANAEFEAQTGLKRSEQLGKTSTELSFQWPEEVRQRYYRVALGGKPLHWERFNESLKRFYDVRVFSPRRGQFAVVFHDITARKQAEETLRRLAQFPAENPGPVLRVAGNGSLLYANEPARAWLATLGWHANDPLPDAVLTIVTAARGQNQVIRREITSADGRTMWLSASQPPAEDYVNLYGNDITERKLAQEALRASEERLDLAFRGAQDGIWDWNIETDEVFYSSRWKMMLGYDESEIEPHASAWKRLLHPDDLPRAMQVVEDVLHGKRGYVMEFRMQHKDGHYVDVLSRGFPVRRGPNGPIVRIVGTHFDLTERKRAELEAERNRAEIAHLSRVAMLSELSGSLAHELNQPLAAILSNAQAAQRFLAEDNVDLNEVRDILKDIVTDDQRAGEVIRRLRLLLKKGEFQLLPLDVNEVVQDVLNLVRNDLLNHDIVLHTDLADKLPSVKGDRVQLEQVLLNLIVNANEAMTNTVTADRQLIVRTAAAGGYVRVSVADRGTGIGPEVLEQLFAPFFTTKATGLGLGLPVSHTIVSAHGGHLKGKNNPDQGATFEVVLPVDDEDSI